MNDWGKYYEDLDKQERRRERKMKQKLKACTGKWRVAKPKRDKDTGEWVNVVYKGNIRDEGKTNYTDDKEDAWATYEDQVKWAERENASCSKRK